MDKKIVGIGLLVTLVSAITLISVEEIIKPEIADALYTLLGLAFIVFNIYAAILLLKQK